MPLFVSSFSQPRHAVFAIERTPPAVITPTGTGVVALVGQFPWGPAQTLYTPSSNKDFINTFAPFGMAHTGSAFLSWLRKGFPVLRVLRITAASGTAAAQVVLNAPGPIAVVTVIAKSVGSAGNSLTATVAPATDGNAAHFNLTVTVTGASGTTSDFLQNLNYSGTGANSTPDFTKTILIGNITFGANGTPTSGTFSFTGGTDGSIASSDYIGTQGLGDKGFSKLEADTSIRHVFMDDPGATLRTAINTGLVAHVGFMGDRVAYINGPSGQTLASTAQTDVGTYRSTRVVYCDPWVYILDELGNKTLVPSASFAASVASQLPTSTSIAWKSPEVVQNMLNGIVDVEFVRGNSAGDNTNAGIATFISEALGGFSIEAGVVTNAPVDPSRRTLARTRVGDLIASSFVNSTRAFVDAPNVPLNQNALVFALENFMSTLKKAQNFDPNHKDFVVDYQIPNLNSANTPNDIASGTFIIPLNVQVGSSMERIFLSIQYGESVSVIHAS